QVLVQSVQSANWLILWEQQVGRGSEANDRSKGTTLAPYFPGWEVLQALGGPIAEVSAFAERSERLMGEPLLVAGRFEKGGLFQASLIPSARPRWRLQVTATAFHAELDFPNGFSGPALLAWHNETGTCNREAWPAQNLFIEMVKVFEDASQRNDAAAS